MPSMKHFIIVFQCLFYDNFSSSSIPNVKERYYRNLERKRIREQKQERERARERERELDQKIECELKIELINKPAASTGPSSDKLTDNVDLEQREDATGYNSEDEYSEHPSKQLTEEEWRQVCTVIH